MSQPTLIQSYLLAAVITECGNQSCDTLSTAQLAAVEAAVNALVAAFDTPAPVSPATGGPTKP